MPVGTYTWQCVQNNTYMTVTHASSSGATLATYSNYVAGDTMRLSGQSCTASGFVNWTGYWQGTVQSSSGNIASGTFDAVVQATAISSGFDINRGTVQRQANVFAGPTPLNYTIHEDANGTSVRMTGARYIQDSPLDSRAHPQLTITDIDLTAATVSTASLFDSVTGHFRFSDGPTLPFTGSVSIDVPIHLTNGGEGAVAGKITMSQDSGPITVLEFSGTGQGNVRVTRAQAPNAAFSEVYNGTVAGLINNH